MRGWFSALHFFCPVRTGIPSLPEEEQNICKQSIMSIWRLENRWNPRPRKGRLWSPSFTSALHWWAVRVIPDWKGRASPVPRSSFHRRQSFHPRSRPPPTEKLGVRMCEWTNENGTKHREEKQVADPVPNQVEAKPAKKKSVPKKSAGKSKPRTSKMSARKSRWGRSWSRNFKSNLEWQTVTNIPQSNPIRSEKPIGKGRNKPVSIRI